MYKFEVSKYILRMVDKYSEQFFMKIFWNYLFIVNMNIAKPFGVWNSKSAKGPKT